MSSSAQIALSPFARTIHALADHFEFTAALQASPAILNDPKKLRMADDEAATLWDRATRAARLAGISGELPFEEVFHEADDRQLRRLKVAQMRKRDREERQRNEALMDAAYA